MFGSATESSASDRAHDDLMQLRQRLAGLGLFEARSLTLVDERALDYTLEPAPDVADIAKSVDRGSENSEAILGAGPGSSG